MQSTSTRTYQSAWHGTKPQQRKKNLHYQRAEEQQAFTDVSEIRSIFREILLCMLYMPLVWSLAVPANKTVKWQCHLCSDNCFRFVPALCGISAFWLGCSDTRLSFCFASKSLLSYNLFVLCSLIEKIDLDLHSFNYQISKSSLSVVSRSISHSNRLIIYRCLQFTLLCFISVIVL